MKPLIMKTVRIRNFKAIQDSGVIRLTPLSVFIGNNGSGKSSFIDALQTLETIIQEDLDRAMAPWHGFEHAWNKAVLHQDRQETKDKRAHQTNPMGFTLTGNMRGKLPGPYKAEIEITMGPGGNSLFIQQETLTLRTGESMKRNDRGLLSYKAWPGGPKKHVKLDDGESMLNTHGIGGMGRWQFLTLVPQNMGEPVPQKRAGGDVRLAKDGSNIAQFLNWIRNKDAAAFEGIVEAMQYVLSYARDLQPQLTSELERAVYLQLTEQEFKIPGWLFSTGTLRVLALLAVLRSPEPPPLILVEEIENGLDPRSLNLVLEEIRTAVEAGDTQVILTTHSSYFLDLLDLSHLVLCERMDGVPVFRRTSDLKNAREWAKSFAPGRLYIMDRLHVEDQS